LELDGAVKLVEVLEHENGARFVERLRQLPLADHRLGILFGDEAQDALRVGQSFHEQLVGVTASRPLFVVDPDGDGIAVRVFQLLIELFHLVFGIVVVGKEQVELLIRSHFDNQASE